MEPFKHLDAVAAPMEAPNVDTDQIIPARFLYRKRNEGWAHLLFHDLRFNDDKTPKDGFLLNTPPFGEAKILVADRNFACGSSREHAVWSLYDYGFRVVIAKSFGDIFFGNSFQNGLLPIVLPPERVEALRAALAKEPGAHIVVDLDKQEVRGPDGKVDHFEIDPFRKECLLAGTDDVTFTLSNLDRIAAFEKVYESKLGWV
jgi:3-isopropylmalate/(R)-2-methylmalate dehydratase small subunit